MTARAPLRSLRVQLAGLAVGACAVGVTTAVALLARATDAAEAAHHAREIAELRHLDAQLNEEILRARFGVRPNYDEVSRLQRALEQRAHVWGAIPPDPPLTEADGGREGDAPLKEARQALAETVKTKSYAVEQLKYWRAIARNSNQYFSSKLVADADPLEGEDRAYAARVERAVMALGLVRDAASVRAVQAILGERGFDEKAAAPDALAQLHRHANTIVTGIARANELRGVLDIPTQTRIDALERVYADREGVNERRNTALLVTLALLSSGLLVAFAYVIRRLSEMNASARRFVPLEFLEMLGKKSLADIQRGDAVRAEMSVLFADIRDFTAKSEKRSPEENFRFMNEYLGAMEGPIHAHGGFVNQYLGDGIMALFPKSADDALRAAHGMFSALEQLNARLGPDAVRIGVGINSGSLMLGTLGGRDRMNAGVISDAVNLAARIEALTKQYNVRLLISDHTRERLRSDAGITLRTVDRVFVKGAQRPVQLYQVIDAEIDHRAEALLTMLPLHEQAMELYLGRRFAEAAPLFDQVRAAVSGDGVSEILARRCQAFAVEPPPTTWDGAERLDDK